ncbi:uncharacterized protein K02A2.6-like [Bactrocera neohumeralis]|uniref:uncharacterized protein K02A2.6-like n=1 Tax=Bactrocera neohumeralis TaxID=98809 RepID=UPI0021659C1D|nr:uncharacterized protein K02A2.6-like [Bactrocera neohumeralis]
MTNDSLIQELVQQQQRFAASLLEQQKQWMQSIQQSMFNADNPNRVKEATVVPPFHAFNKDHQNWESYLEQLSQHFMAYSVSSPDKQKSFFLSWVGMELFELLKNLFGVATLQSQTYTQLTDKLTEHFQSKRHVVAARYEFFKREMKHKQTHREWVAELRGIARECKFNCSATNCSANFVDEMIRDQIILNTPYDQVRAAALQKLQPSLEDVLLIAETYETTTKTVATIKENTNSSTMQVNAMQTRKNWKKTTKDETKREQNINANVMKQVKLKSCAGCGISHNREECKFRKAICNKCAKKGHIAAVCMSNQSKSIIKSTTIPERKWNQNKQENEQYVSTLDTVNIVNGIIEDEANKKCINLEISNKVIQFQLDSGATVSIINLKTYNILNRPKLEKCTKTLYAFGQQPIPILGELHTKAKCGNKQKRIAVIVANIENANNLFGLDLFKEFGFEITQIDNVVDKGEYIKQIEDLCNKYKTVFNNTNAGVIKNFKASIRMQTTAIPKFYKSRQIPFAQMSKFREEADRLINTGIWKPVKFSNWASPIVLAPKPDGSMELDEDSKQVMVVNTPLGLFQYQRLPYGIASAPAIFQRYLEQLLNGIEGCGNYLDDIIITAPSLQEHVKRVEQVIKILEDNGIKCKKEKCFFLKEEIEYLGRRVSANGILPDYSGIQAVKQLKPPMNITQLEAFIGKVNYYCNFIPNFSQLAAPLNKLRRKNVHFTWGSEQQQAFKDLKLHIINATQLAHFNEQLPITLATDASSFGIGAVLSHIYPDGNERPIAFASKTMDTHQLKYSQIEKEGLAIVFGVKKFHQYLYGRKFLLITDHKPLINIFNPSKHLPQMTSHRIQRWAIILMAYQFDIKYRNTHAHGNADALSRLPVSTDIQFDTSEACYNVTHVQLPINANIIRKHTERDEILRKVKHFVKSGWPSQLSPGDNEIRPYFHRRLALTFHENLLCLHANVKRIVIPESLQQNILELLHDGHWGTVRMKQLARHHVWWPNIDDDIAKVTRQCEICKVGNPAPTRQYLSWPEAKAPWERVHIDFAGPIFDSMWLICIDAYSQFPFVTQLSSTTTDSTIHSLKSIFAIEGFPNTLVSDNGPQLTSDAFKQFCKLHGITHITTAPFHPASNGLAERFVQTFKTAVRKNINEGLSIRCAVVKFLATYRFTPNSNGKTPAELIHGRSVRTMLTQLFETPTQSKSKIVDTHKFQPNELVYARNFAKGEKWIKGIIIHPIGKMMFMVKSNRGTIRRHINQLKPRSNEEGNNKTPSIILPDQWIPVPESTSTHSATVMLQDKSNIQPDISTQVPHFKDQNSAPSQIEENVAEDQNSNNPIRRSNRSRQQATRFTAPDFRNK